MSMWNMLTFLEISDTNAKIDSLSRDYEEYREEQEAEKKQAISDNIAVLFQELYTKNNDISKIDLSIIPNIKNLINTRYINYENIDHNSKHNYGTISFAIILSAAIFFILTMLNNDSMNPIILTVLLIIAGFFLFSSILNIINRHKFIENFNIKSENQMKELPILKTRFPDLSSYGIYLKWYLDFKCKDTIELLKKQDDAFDPYETLKKLYTLFDLDANPEISVDKSFINSLNKKVIEHYDNLPIPDVERVNNDIITTTTVTYSNDNNYTGELKNGLPHGKGKLIYPNGDIYKEGIFSDGNLHGIGKMIYENGDIYEGYFKHGSRDGQGIYKFHDGNIYEGEYKDGLRDGFGKFIWESKNGDFYDGQWRQDKQYTDDITPIYNNSKTIEKYFENRDFDNINKLIKQYKVCENKPGLEQLVKRLLKIEPNHEDALIILADIYQEQEKDDDAQLILEKLYKSKNKNDIEKLGFTRELSELYEHQGNYESSEAILRESLDVAKNCSDAEADEYCRDCVLDFQYSLGKNLATQKKYEAAEEILKQNIKLSEETDDYIRHLRYERLADIYIAQGKFNKCLPMLEYVVDYNEKQYEHEKKNSNNQSLVHPIILVLSLEKLGEVYRILKKYEKSEILLNRSLILWTNFCNTDDVLTCKIMHKMVLLYVQQDKLDLAVPLIQRIVSFVQANTPINFTENEKLNDEINKIYTEADNMRNKDVSGLIFNKLKYIEL